MLLRALDRLSLLTSCIWDSKETVRGLYIYLCVCTNATLYPKESKVTSLEGDGHLCITEWIWRNIDSRSSRHRDSYFKYWRQIGANDGAVRAYFTRIDRWHYVTDCAPACATVWMELLNWAVLSIICSCSKAYFLALPLHHYVNSFLSQPIGNPREENLFPMKSYLW